MGLGEPGRRGATRRSIYDKGETDESNRQESAVEMTSSQDNATAAALSALGVSYQTEVAVSTVADDGASAGDAARRATSCSRSTVSRPLTRNTSST